MKKRVGTILGKPVIQGNQNELTKNEILLKDPDKLTLSVRKDNGELVTNSSNAEDNFCDKHTLFYWNEASCGSNNPILFIDVDAKLGRILIPEGGFSYLQYNEPTFKLPLKGSTFYYVNESSGNNITLNNTFGGINYRGTYIFNSKQECAVDNYSGFSIVSNPKTLSDRIDFKVKLIAKSSLKEENYLNIPGIYKANENGVNSYGCVASSGYLPFYLHHDAWLLTPSGKTIKIQEYVEPQTSTYSLRSLNKSYRVSSIESYIEEEKSKENPDEEKIKALTIIRDRYAEEDALKK